MRIAASAPPADMPLYPELPEETSAGPEKDGGSFRLQTIGELQTWLEAQRDGRAALYKKYRRGVNVADGIDTALVATGMAAGAIGIGLLTTVVAAPVVVVLEVTALACGLAGIGCKFVSRRLLTKARKHDEIRILAETKLNTISDHISHALRDNVISDEEFRLILDEVEKYKDMKRQIRDKAFHAHGAVKMDEEQKTLLIAQGREEARADMVKAMGGK